MNSSNTSHTNSAQPPEVSVFVNTQTSNCHLLTTSRNQVDGTPSPPTQATDLTETVSDTHPSSLIAVSQADIFRTAKSLRHSNSLFNPCPLANKPSHDPENAEYLAHAVLKRPILRNRTSYSTCRSYNRSCNLSLHTILVLIPVPSLG